MDTPQGVAGNLKQAGPSTMKATAPPCGFSGDTEILTRHGWMRFSQLTYMSEVATRSPEGMFEWQYPEKITCQPYEGEMVEFQNRAVSLFVTPCFPMLVRRRKLKRQKESSTHTPGHDWHLRRADYFASYPGAVFEVPATSRWSGLAPPDFILPATQADRRHPAWDHATEWLAGFLKQDWTPSAQVAEAAKAAGIGHNALGAARRNLGVTSRRIGCSMWQDAWWEMSAPTRVYVPHSGPYQPVPELRMPMAAFCAFLGLYLAEGWVRKDRNGIQIAQLPTSRHMPEIQRILDATGLHWNYTSSNARFTASHKNLAIWLDENCGYRAWNKHLPAGFLNYHRRLLEAILGGMMIGDGFWGTIGQRRYMTTSAALAESVQEMLQKTGCDSWVKQLDLRPYRNTKAKRVSYVVFERLRDTHLLPVPVCRRYEGDIFRIGVPNGVIYVRRNRKPIWAADGEGVAQAP